MISQKLVETHLNSIELQDLWKEFQIWRFYCLWGHQNLDYIDDIVWIECVSSLSHSSTSNAGTIKSFTTPCIQYILMSFTIQYIEIIVCMDSLDFWFFLIDTFSLNLRTHGGSTVCWIRVSVDFYQSIDLKNISIY